MSHTVKFFKLLLLTVAVFGWATASQLLAFEGQRPTFVQAMVGAANFAEDDLTFTRASSPDSTATDDNDLSQMPYLGMSFQYPFRGENTQVGLDGGFLFGWRSKGTKAAGGSGQVAISIDSSLWLLDLGAGVFVKHTFGERWRLYAAAGPAMVFGDYSEEADEEHFDSGEVSKSESSDTEFGVGAYARAGFDYRFGHDAYVGLCVRGLKTNIEFEAAPEASSGLSGVQGFLTFSRHF